MKTSNLNKTLSLVLGGAFMFYASAYAEEPTRNPEAGKKPASQFDQPESHNHRQKLQHSLRKQAAQRLKAQHDQAREYFLVHQHETKGSE